MDIKEKVHTVLCEWVLRVVDKKEMATPDELAVLPKIAKLALNYTPSIDYTRVNTAYSHIAGNPTIGFNCAKVGGKSALSDDELT